MKKWLVVLLIAGILFAGFIVFSSYEPMKSQGGYYGKLKTACADTLDKACCEESVKRMETLGALLASKENKQCPTGFSADTLRCLGSYTWCGPKTEPAVITSAKPTTCPQWAPPAPDYCTGGNILPGKLDANGCRGPQSCDAQTYTACGCGCCGGSEPVTKCLYKSQGDDINAAIDLDQKIRNDKEACALAGCSRGVTYRYCDSTATATPELADAPVVAVLAPKRKVEACGKVIQYTGTTRAPGTRSDWQHAFEIQNTEEQVLETLTGFGTGEHKLASQQTGITILVQKIDQTEPHPASIVVDCGI